LPSPVGKKPADDALKEKMHEKYTPDQVGPRAADR
jgi:hypothetical protein